VRPFIARNKEHAKIKSVQLPHLSSFPIKDVKFVFNSKELLDLVAEAEAEVSKKKSEKGRGKRDTTPRIEEEEEEVTGEDEFLRS